MTDPETTHELSRCNQAFYEAFEARDLDAMSDIWEHSDRVSCTHPGWSVLRGWGAVAASWLAMFQGPQQIQFILTDEHVEVDGDLGWVTVDENIIGDQTGSTVSALNVFVRGEHGWRLVAHHGSAVVS
ncbi:MAG: nuclear transport factor 2 family protein [Acidimicrobiales bacterium]